MLTKAFTFRVLSRTVLEFSSYFKLVNRLLTVDLSRIMKLVKLIWTLLCLLGNITQLHYISIKYLRYDVATNVRVTFPEKFDAPSMTACMDAWRMIDWEKLLTNDNYTGARDELFKEIEDKKPFRSMRPNKTNLTIMQNFLTEIVGNDSRPLFAWNLIDIATYNKSLFFDVTFDIAKLFEDYGITFLEPETYRSLLLRFANETIFGTNFVNPHDNRTCVTMVESIGEFFSTMKCFTLHPQPSCARDMNYDITRNQYGGHIYSTILFMHENYLHEKGNLLLV